MRDYGERAVTWVCILAFGFMVGLLAGEKRQDDKMSEALDECQDVVFEECRFIVVPNSDIDELEKYLKHIHGVKHG